MNTATKVAIAAGVGVAAYLLYRQSLALAGPPDGSAPASPPPKDDFSISLGTFTPDEIARFSEADKLAYDKASFAILVLSSGKGTAGEVNRASIDLAQWQALPVFVNRLLAAQPLDHIKR